MFINKFYMHEHWKGLDIRFLSTGLVDMKIYFVFN